VTDGWWLVARCLRGRGVGWRFRLGKRIRVVRIFAFVGIGAVKIGPHAVAFRHGAVVAEVTVTIVVV